MILIKKMKMGLIAGISILMLTGCQGNIQQENEETGEIKKEQEVTIEEGIEKEKKEYRILDVVAYGKYGGDAAVVINVGGEIVIRPIGGLPVEERINQLTGSCIKFSIQEKDYEKAIIVECSEKANLSGG